MPPGLSAPSWSLQRFNVTNDAKALTQHRYLQRLQLMTNNKQWRHRFTHVTHFGATPRKRRERRWALVYCRLHVIVPIINCLYQDLALSVKISPDCIIKWGVLLPKVMQWIWPLQAYRLRLNSSLEEQSVRSSSRGTAATISEIEYFLFHSRDHMVEILLKRR